MTKAEPCTRVNIGNAALFGLKDDLHLRGDEYNTALVILCVEGSFSASATPTHVDCL